MEPPPDPDSDPGPDRGERAAFREFVRTHHPDRGGDPEVFAAGLARFRAARRHPVADAPPDDVPDDARGPLPLPVRVGVALIRTWKRRRGGRAG